jgi:predicted glycosyltransferase
MAMSAPVLYVAITNHGFGHATRAAAVAATIQVLCPDIEIILATTAPEWLLASYLSGPVTLRPQALDVGCCKRTA